MRKIFALLLLVTNYCNSQNNIDVKNYRFYIQLSDINDTLYGRAEIKAVALKTVNEVSLDLASVNKSGKGMIVRKVSGKQGKRYTFVLENDQLKISFPEDFHTGDSVFLCISYKGIPADGLIISRNKFGNRTFFADNWPDRAHQWIPCVDDPSDKASVDFITVAPEHYKVVSNGLLQEEKLLPDHNKFTYWKETIDLPTKVMVIGVADFKVDTLAPFSDVDITSWSFPENAKKAKEDYSFATEILKYFSNTIAPYPYKKLANVQSKTVYGGMENASAIFYYENSVNGLKDNEELLAHEIAHQWFGDMLTEKSYPHVWLSEGFATYFTHLYLEAKYGDETFRTRLASDRQRIIAFAVTKNLPVVDSVSKGIELLNTNSYQKGAWVLHMLRHELGDSIFFKAITKFYNDFAGYNAQTSDLQKVFEVVSGKTLTQFFKQWLFTPGIPVLKVDWKYLKKSKKIQLTVTQQQKPLFQFPLEISTNDNNSTIKLNITKAKQTFTIPVKKEVTETHLDPNTSLLFKELK